MYVCVYLLLERGEGREKEGEKHQYERETLTGCLWDQTRIPGMCPDWELNRQPFALWDGSQPTEPHQPGQNEQLFNHSLQLFSCFSPAAQLRRRPSLPFTTTTCQSSPSNAKLLKQCLQLMSGWRETGTPRGCPQRQWLTHTFPAQLPD